MKKLFLILTFFALTFLVNSQTINYETKQTVNTKYQQFNDSTGYYKGLILNSVNADNLGWRELFRKVYTGNSIDTNKIVMGLLSEFQNELLKDTAAFIKSRMAIISGDTVGVIEFYTRNVAGNLIKVGELSNTQNLNYWKLTPQTNTNELQSITLNGLPACALGGGTYQLCFGPAVPANCTTLPYNANAAAIQAGLESTALIGVGNVSVTGTLTGVNIEFIGTLAGASQALITGDFSALLDAGLAPLDPSCYPTIAQVTAGGILITPPTIEIKTSTNQLNAEYNHRSIGHKYNYDVYDTTKFTGVRDTIAYGHTYSGIMQYKHNGDTVHNPVMTSYTVNGNDTTFSTIQVGDSLLAFGVRKDRTDTIRNTQTFYTDSIITNHVERRVNNIITEQANTYLYPTKFHIYAPIWQTNGSEKRYQLNAAGDTIFDIHYIGPGIPNITIGEGMLASWYNTTNKRFLTGYNRTKANYPTINNMFTGLVYDSNYVAITVDKTIGSNSTMFAGIQVAKASNITGIVDIKGTFINYNGVKTIQDTVTFNDETTWISPFAVVNSGGGHVFVVDSLTGKVIAWAYFLFDRDGTPTLTSNSVSGGGMYDVGTSSVNDTFSIEDNGTGILFRSRIDGKKVTCIFTIESY